MPEFCHLCQTFLQDQGVIFVDGGDQGEWQSQFFE